MTGEKKMDPLALRVARRFTAESQLDEKMKALLLKLRKGADSSLSVKQLLAVLALLGGWRVEKFVGLAPVHYENQTGALANHKEQLVVEGDEAAAQDAYAKIKAAEVSSKPTNPQDGKHYVMDLEPFGLLSNHYKTRRGIQVWGARYRVWIGVPAMRFTDPEGKIFEWMADRQKLTGGMSGLDQERGLIPVDVKGLTKLPIYDVTGWLKKDTTWIAQINEVLGLEEHVPADQRTRDNTGTCAVCFRNIKLVRRGTDTFMALHGYNRPGQGYIVGKCWGGDHAPYELSCEATKEILAAAKEKLAGQEKYLASLKHSDLKSFTVESVVTRGMKTITKDEENPRDWESMLGNHIKSTEREIEQSKHSVKLYGWLIGNWEVRELPSEGSKHIDWFSKAYRAAGV